MSEDNNSASAAADISLDNTAALQKRCALCGKLGNKENKIKVCSGCMNIWYCSKECQGADWKRHKPDCKEFRKWVNSLQEGIQTYRIKAPIEWNKMNQSNFNQDTKKKSIAILEDSEKMLFNPENIRAVISDKSIEGHSRIKELLSILSFIPIPIIQSVKYPQLILIDELIKAAQMQDNVAISRISDDGITTKGTLNNYGVRRYLNKFGNVVSMYEGQFINGSLSKGVYTNNVDNSIYDGEFKDDKKNGQGTLSLLDGSYTYNGDFKDGERHGQGIEVSPQGTMSGHWKNGFYDGEMRLTQNNTEIVYVYFYVDGVEDESKRQIIEPKGGKTRRKKTNRKSRKIKRLSTNRINNLEGSKY